MSGITNYISFGKFDLKYILMISVAISILFIGRAAYSNLYLSKKEDGSPEKDHRKLLKSFLKYIGFSLCVIGELIRRKLSFGNEKDEDPLNKPMFEHLNLPKKKEASSHLINYKDIIFIVLISLIHLVDEFLAIIIKVEYTANSIQIDEKYNILEFNLLFFTSLIIFKMHYYKHQYISIILIIILEIIRMIYKIIVGDEHNFMLNVGLQLVRAFIDSVFIGYANGLMEYKFFSPYKALYIFGFINGVIILIIYFIFTYIPYDNDQNKYFSLEYNGKRYFDNFYAIFEGFNFFKFIGLFLYMISAGGSQLLFNFIANDFTMCHIFIYYQIYVLVENIMNGYYIITIITGVIELFVTLVFLEIIEMKCFGLNKNIKKNIEERAYLDSNNVNMVERNDSDEFNDNLEDKKESYDSFKNSPILPLNELEEKEK